MRREKLLEALKVASPVKSDVAVFDKGWIRTLHESFSVSYKFDTGVKGVLSIYELIKVLKMMKSHTVTITSNGDQVVFKCGASELSLSTKFDPCAPFYDTEHIETFLETMDLDNVKWSPIPPRLMEGLKLSLLCAEDYEIGKLTGIVITNGVVLSTDNYRISMYDLVDEMEQDVRLRTKTVKTILKMKKPFDFVGFSEQWFHLKSKDNLIVSLKLLPLTYYPTEDIIPVFDKDSDEVYELPANLERFIDRAEVFAGIGVGELNFSNQITLKSEDGHLVVTGKNGIGQLISKLPWNGYLPEVTITPDTLKQVMGITREFKVIRGFDPSIIKFQIPGFQLVVQGKAEERKEGEENGTQGN